MFEGEKVVELVFHFSRVPKRWGRCGERLDSVGRNFYLKARMSVHLSLNRFVPGVRLILAFGTGHSSSFSLSTLTWCTYLLTVGLFVEGGVYLGGGVRSSWPKDALFRGAEQAAGEAAKGGEQ